MPLAFPRPTFLEFIRSRIGSDSYVLASRSTPNIRRKYPNAKVVTPKQHSKIEADYRAEFGCALDYSRGDLFIALKQASASLEEGDLREKIDALLAREAAGRTFGPAMEWPR
ncbi:hypothetical protein [Terrarubrum flagellatum]|uniref:hypothetical protein n=1 Tax=Terrirubrum flagellatum TaxID=2895980 RepID=UPI003144DB73